MVTSIFGDRIRSERKNISLSQAEMAERAGITMRTQRNYETGVRIPDAAYLEALAHLGVDISFVVTGRQTIAPPTALQELADELAAKAGVPSAALKTMYNAKLVQTQTGDDDRVSPQPWNPACSTGSAANGDLDVPTLSVALTALEVHLAQRGKTLPADKKAHAVAVLYRYIRKAGQLDPSILDSLLEIAG